MEFKIKSISISMARYLSFLFRCLIYNIRSLANANTYPEFLVFYVTFRCNSRCKACNVWKGNDAIKEAEELTIEQIDNIFSDPLFRKLKHVNIQGGEATLRGDLAEIAGAIIKRVPSLELISLTSNGLNTEIVVSQTKRLYELCCKSGVSFGLGFSIDGVGEYHDFARGPNAFARVCNSIEAITEMRKSADFSFGTNCVLTANNIHNIEEIITFQKETFNMTIPNFTVVEFREHFLNKKDSPESKELLFTENPNERKLLIDYLSQYNTPKKIKDFMSFRYEQLRGMLEDNKPRTQSCQYKISGLVLDHRGNLMLCPVAGHLGSCLTLTPSKRFFSGKTKAIRKDLCKTTCKGCYPYNFYPSEKAKDLLKYTVFFLKSRFDTRL